MSQKACADSHGIRKMPTGIQGFDELLGGGLPAGRTTLISGGSGAGKTVLTLQALVHGAGQLGEPGIFVAFEESAARLRASAASFGWNLAALEDKSLFFLDAQPQPEWMQSGRFDLNGLLAGLDEKIGEMGARRIAFDAIEVVLALMDDRRSIQQQVHLLSNWLAERELTAFMTYKLGTHSELTAQLEFLQFMVDCSIKLTHEMIDGVTHRSVRIVKYRGASFEENPAPYLIGGKGVPGTAKTTLGGAFSKAACQRGESTLLVSFDSRVDEIVRNLKSVNIDLTPAVEDQLLNMIPARSVSGSAESHLMKIQQEAIDHDVRCIVIDPVSIKSRGTGHSNQVREVLLSGEGIRLADVYTAGGEVLMGALRYEKEREEEARAARRAKDLERRRLELDYESAALEARLETLSRELKARRAEYKAVLESEEEQADKSKETGKQVRRMRGGDSPSNVPPGENREGGDG